MNEIWIIVTEGCEGCRIATNLVNKAVEKSGQNIKVDVINNLDESYKPFIKTYDIKDFPTIVFIKNNVVMATHTGTMAVPQLLHEIKLWF
jgi:hypothetical protein